MQKTKIGKEPVVILPMKKWREIEDALEDAEMYSSKKFWKDLKKAEKEKTFSLEEVEKKLGLNKNA